MPTESHHTPTTIRAAALSEAAFPATPVDAQALPPGPLLRTFFNIADAWQLDRATTMTLLGTDSTTTYSNWKRSPDTARLRTDTLERLSYVFGIYKALQLLLPNKEAADSWVYKPNDATLFGGKPAIERMTTGFIVDLAKVREYLDAMRGW